MSWQDVQSAWKGLAPVAKKMIQELLAREPKTIVELGVDMGFSLFSFATLYPEAHVYGIDHFLHNAERSLGKVRQHQDQFPNVTLVIEDLRTAASSWWPFGQTVDVIHHDAKHNETVQGDLDAWLPLLAPGGVVLFHDYSPNFPKLVEIVNALPGRKLVWRLNHGLAGWKKPVSDEADGPDEIVEVSLP